MNPSEAIAKAYQEMTAQPAQLVRVFEIDYVCGICNRRHTADPHFISSAPDLDTLHAETMRILNNEHDMLGILKSSAMVQHHDQGDLEKYNLLSTEERAQRTFTVLGITMTAEDRFICDECGHEFQTLPERWLHMGRHPRNGHRIGEYACARFEEQR